MTRERRELEAKLDEYYVARHSKDVARQEAAYDALLALAAPETTPAGVLDEAWEAAEKALPEGWTLDIWRTYTGDPYQLGYGVEATLPEAEDAIEESGPTLVAALHALAAALGRSGSDGGRG